MATDEEIQRIVFEVANRKALDDANMLLKDEVENLQKLQANIPATAAAQAQWNQQIAQSATFIKVQKDEIARLTMELDKLEEAGGGFRLRGGMRSDLILAHAFRELTSETATLTEKIERLGMITPYVAGMFGASGTWLMGITLGVTAVAELASKWKELLAALGDHGPLDAAKMIEELTARGKAAIEEYAKLVVHERGRGRDRWCVQASHRPAGAANPG